MTTTKSSIRRRAGVGALAVAAASLGLATGASAVTATTDLNLFSGLAPDDVAQELVGPGVTVSDVTHMGSPVQAGTFGGGADSIGFESGVILSTGDVADAIGPNTGSGVNGGASNDLGGPGDADLTALAGYDTNDASVLEFDFVPDGDTIFFQYVFASEEYNEFVNTQFNDTFGFFVNGENCAMVDTDNGPQPISVNTINNGQTDQYDPFTFDPTATNPDLYIDNDLYTGAAIRNTEYDGMTVVLTCMSPVNNGEVNHMKLAIADGSDHVLDAGVFLKQGSLSTTPPAGSGKVTGGGKVPIDGGDITLGAQVIDDDLGPRGNLQVNDHRTGDNLHGYSVDSLAVDTEAQTATWSGEARWNGEDGYGYQISVADLGQGRSKHGSPDTVSIVVTDADEAVVWSTDGDREVRFGNITVHIDG